MKDNERARDGQYGKFDTAESLLSAYNALEAQFTKRCQLIKELQAELERSAQAEQAPIGAESGAEHSAENSAPAPRTENAGEFVTERQAAADTARQTLAYDDVLKEIGANAAAYAEALSAVPEIMDACVALYKQRRLCGGHSPVPRGAAVLTPVKRPNTLAEAKILADALLNM